MDKLIGWEEKNGYKMNLIKPRSKKKKKIGKIKAYAADNTIKNKNNDRKKNLLSWSSKSCLHSQIYYEFGHTS